MRGMRQGGQGLREVLGVCLLGKEVILLGMGIGEIDGCIFLKESQYLEPLLP